MYIKYIRKSQHNYKCRPQQDAPQHVIITWDVHTYTPSMWEQEQIFSASLILLLHLDEPIVQMHFKRRPTSQSGGNRVKTLKYPQDEELFHREPTWCKVSYWLCSTTYRQTQQPAMRINAKYPRSKNQKKKKKDSKGQDAPNKIMACQSRLSSRHVGLNL